MSQSGKVCTSYESGTHTNNENSSPGRGKKRRHNSSAPKENSKRLKQEKENTGENSIQVINSASLEKVKQFITVFVNNFKKYLEVEKPELLISSIIMNDIRLWEPLQHSIKLLMTSIIERNDLSKNLMNAINLLSDREVRKTLKYTKRDKIDKTSKHVKIIRVKLKNWNSVLVEDLENLNII